MKLNIRIQREEASTGDIKRGWANSTQAEDKDSGSNPGKEEMGGSRFRIQVVGNTKQICKCEHCRQFIGEHLVYNDSMRNGISTNEVSRRQGGRKKGVKALPKVAAQ